jgi:hypothetical protein
MSITKPKTIGNWRSPRPRERAEGEGQDSVRGRIITGLLTGDDGSDEADAAPDAHARRGE